jgi:hypothetical protein
VYVSTDREGDQEVYTIPSRGGASTKLTDNRWQDFEPVYSPDGTKIAFASHARKCFLSYCYPLRKYEIFTMPSAGGTPTKVTSDKNDDRNPVWGALAEFTPPLMTKGPAHELVADRILNQGGAYYVPVKLQWEATDGAGSEGWASGIARYALQQSIDGTAYANDPQYPMSTATSVNEKLVPGHTYQFRVRAQDRAGNWSEWAEGLKFRVSTFQENDTQWVSYPLGAWTRSALDGAYNEHVQLTKGSGATANFSFTGNQVAWVATKNSDRGQAKVWIDGVEQKTVDLFSSLKQTRKMVLSKSWATTGSHTVKVTGLATPGRPTVDVDAFVVLNTESPGTGPPGG